MNNSNKIQDINSSNSNEDEDFLDPNIKKKRLIVEEDCLLQLFRICKEKGCGAAIDPAEIKLCRTGGALQITATCNAHHVEEWASSSVVGESHQRLFVINILMVILKMF